MFRQGISNGRSLENRDPAFLLSISFIWDWLYKNYFHVQSSGWMHMPEEKALIVGSHNGGLSCPDLAMFYCDWIRNYGAERKLYGLMHRAVWKGNPIAADFAEKIGAIEAHPTIAIDAFNHGASVLVFPGGGKDAFRPFHLWDKIHFAKHRGFIKLALKMNVPIVPWVSVGSHHTLYVLADFAPLLKQLIKKGMPWPYVDPEVVPLTLSLPFGLTFGPVPNIPLPRTIYYKIGEPIYLRDQKDANKAYSRAFVDDCYHLVVNKMQNLLDELIAGSEYRKPVEKIPELVLS